MTTVGLWRSLMAQPTTRREYRSSNTATYSQPVRVGMKVRSPAHTRFVAGTANRCARRLGIIAGSRSEEHTSELQSRGHLVCRLLLEKKKKNNKILINKKKDKN